MDDINLNLLTGINQDLGGNKVSIYPNPATGNIKINCASLKTESLDILICDALGRNILRRHHSLPQNEIDLDLSAFNSGIYFICLETTNGKIVKKLVLNRP